MEISPKFQIDIRKDPLLFLDGVLDCGHWSKQDEIIESIFKNQRTTVKSCHGIGKSYIIARSALAFLYAYKDSIVITTAPTFRQVENIIWREMRLAYKQSRLPLGGNMFKTKYEIDEKWYALWLSSDKEDNFQGFHATNILILVDEAWWVWESTLTVIEALMTSQWTKLCYIWNPTQSSWGFYDSHKSDIYHKISISCFQTPNFRYFGIKDVEDLLKYTKDELRDLKLPYPELVTPLWVYERVHDWWVDSPIFQSRVLWIFPEEWEDTLIKLNHMEKALIKEWTDEEWKLRSRKKCIWIDVARFGSDTTVLIWMDNFKMDKDIVWHKGKDTMVTVWKAIAYFNQLWYKKQFDYFVVDDTWVGWGVTDRLVELGYNVIPVNNASQPQDKETFRDIKGEIYWSLRLWFIQGVIKIYDILRIIADLSSIKYDYTSNWKIFIVSKKDMKKQWLDSPDYADALALAYYGCSIIDWWDYVEDEDEKDEWTITGNIDNKSF